MDLTPALERGVGFLLSAESASGWWRDFDTLAGPGDEWVSAYVAAALASAPDPRARPRAWCTWRRLRRRRWWSGGWGYNGKVPGDADSTIWSLRLAHALGAGGSLRARRGYRFLARHLRPDGGVSTYSEEGPIRHFTRVRPSFSFRGWCGAHACVTAAAASLPEIGADPRVRAYLRRAQSDDGGWTAYWWCDRSVATALAAEALAESSAAEDADARCRAAAWAVGRVREDGSVGSVTHPAGSAFAAAWCLRLLLLGDGRGGHMADPVPAAAWLLRSQRANGSWPASAALRIPPPDVEDPERYERWALHGRGGGSILLDGNAIFTTATVVDALGRMARALDGRRC
jgi:squalene-hopene/tetraprenyl-beta-curcumene cyclase